MRVTAAFLTVLCAILYQQARADDPPARSEAAVPMTAAPITAAATTSAQSAAERGATPPAEKGAASGAEQKGAPEGATTVLKPGVTVVGSKPDLTADEKELLSQGYKLETHNGEKYFCRKEQQMGSRFEHKTCDTAQSALLRRAESREAVRVIQTNSPHVNN
jgi:hypothetical protein